MKTRIYDDACAANHAIDILGQRWVLAIIRELVLGPKRFSDLRADLRDVSANILSQKLELLENRGLVVHHRLPPPALTPVYGLTRWGMEAAPILQAMARWGARSPDHDMARPMSATSFILSLRSMIDNRRATGFAATIGFKLGRESFLVGYGSDGVMPQRADPSLGKDCEAIVEGTPGAAMALVHRKVPLQALEASGDLIVTGDRAIVRKLPLLYPPRERAIRPHSPPLSDMD